MEWYWIVAIAWAVGTVAFVAGAYWAGSRRPRQEWQHSFLTGMMAIFHEGEIARARCFLMKENPYVHGTPEWRSWNFGWAWVDSRTKDDSPYPPIKA